MDVGHEATTILQVKHVNIRGAAIDSFHVEFSGDRSVGNKIWQFFSSGMEGFWV